MQLILPPKIPYLKPVLVGLGVLLVAAFVAPLFVSTDRLQKNLSDTLAKSTGLTVKVAVVGSVSAFPSPHVTLADISIGTEGEEPLLYARSGQLQLGWAGLFSGITAPHVVLSAPTFRTPKTTSITDVTSLASTLCKTKGDITFTGAELFVPRPDDATKTLHVESVNGNIACTTGSLALSLTGTAYHQTLTVHLNSGTQPGTPLSLSVSEKVGHTISYSGTVPAAGAESTGTLAVHLAGPSTSAALFDVKGDATLNKNELWLHRTEAAIQGTTANIAAYASLRQLPTLAMDVQGKMLDLSPLVAQLKQALDQPNMAATDATNVHDSHNVFLQLRASTATLGTRNLSTTSLIIEHNGADALINDVNATLEDGSTFSFDGRYTNRTLGARIEEKASLEGHSFKHLLALFESSASNLPEKDFGAYGIAGNVFWSHEQFRVSEADVKIGDLQFTGGLSTYFEKTTRSEAEIRVTNVNLDYFRNAWREAKQSNGGNYTLFLLSGSEFGWLKHLESVIDLNVWFDRFTLFDRQGTTGNVHIIAKPSELALSNIQLTLPEGVLSGRLSLLVGNERPRVALVASMPFYDSAYTLLANDTPTKSWIDPTKPDARFSEAMFDFSWTSAIDGDFDININHLTWNGEDYGFFKTKGVLTNQNITFSNFALNAFGGQLSATGTLAGGKVPALSANFALYNTHIEDMLDRLGILAGITGRANISGTLTTSGLTFLEWVKLADVRSSLTARGVRIPSFNLQGVLETVQAARRTEDVVKGVAQMMTSGISEFSVDGNLNISQSIIRTPGLTLSNATQTTGTLGGQVELLPWKMNLDAKFQFPQISATVVPTFGINVSGPIDQYTIRTDTASLEAYVAKRIVGQ